MYSTRQKIERIIIQLKVLSKLNKNEKLIFRNKAIYIQINGYMTACVRQLYGDSRSDSINGLSDIVDDIERVIDECKEEEDKSMLSRLYDSLDSCICDPGRGLHNLVETYSTDKAMVSHLETYIERMLVSKNNIEKITGVKPMEN